jgi:hypothetical protein
VVIGFTLRLALDEWGKDREISSGFGRGILLNLRPVEFSVLVSFPFLVLFLGFSLWRMPSFPSPTELVGEVLSVGLMTGLIAINGAHELVHRRKGW